MLSVRENKHTIRSILWRDAAYSYERELPPALPFPQLTVGFIVDETDKFINIATNVDYDESTGDYIADDGYLIPKKTIIKIDAIGAIREPQQ